jgi:hypothetical protein
MSSCFRRLFLLVFVPLVKAYKVFETTCSAPNPHSEFMFVSSPNTRGTLDILWSSLFTILACTWTLHHPDVPEPRNDLELGVLGDIKWALKAFGNSALMMVITALAPEIVIASAFSELMGAMKTQQMMEEYAFNDQVAWSLRHSYFVKMGGFAIRSEKPLDASEKQDTKSRGGKLHCISADELYKLRHDRVIESLPDIRAEEVKDKSKSDTLSKFIAIGQIAWTIVQIIARAAKRLPVSPLEIAVVAFAACAVIVYGLYMKKPQRVSTPIATYHYIGQKDTLGEILEECRKMAREKKEEEAEKEAGQETHGNSHGSRAVALDPEIQSFIIRPKKAIKKRSDWSMWIIIGVTVIFGGIHVIAWNFAFPTTIELIGWRCASVYLTASSLGLLMSYWIPIMNHQHLLRDGLFSALGVVAALPLCFLFYLYILARLFILVEIFRTLFFLPAGSFVSTWASNIPHVG